MEPVNVMGMSKALHERVVGSFAGKGMRVGIVRYGNVPGLQGVRRAVFPAAPPRRFRAPAGHRPAHDPLRSDLEGFRGPGDARLRPWRGGRETFVLDLPSFNIWQVAEVMAEAAGRPVAVEEIGIRPGEKLHETLISNEEIRRSARHDGFWTIRRYRSGQELFAPAQSGGEPRQ